MHARVRCSRANLKALWVNPMRMKQKVSHRNHYNILSVSRTLIDLACLCTLHPAHVHSTAEVEKFENKVATAKASYEAQNAKVKTDITSAKRGFDAMIDMELVTMLVTQVGAWRPVRSCSNLFEGVDICDLRCLHWFFYVMN